MITGPDVNAARGYQDVGHDGSWQGMNRAQWRDAWMGQGRLSTQAADSWLRSHGAREVNAGSGVWRTPYGETLDLQIARRAADRNGGMVTAGWGSTSGGRSGGSGAGGNTMAAKAPSGQQNELMNILMGRIKQTVVPSANDPTINAQANAYTAEGERSRRGYLAEQAEMQGPYAQGALANEGRLTAERLGQQSGAYRSNLVAQEIGARRQEVQNALTQYGSLLTEQQRMALQKELANLDASLQRASLSLQRDSLSQQQSQFNDMQALNWGQFNWQMNPNNPNFY